MRWPKYWSFSISPSNKYSRLMSFRIDTDWLVSSPCIPRDSQESSPASQFECINSLALSLLYRPALITILDHCEDHRLHYTDIVGRVMSLLFSTLSRFVIAFLPQSKTSSDFIATVTILSDFRAQEEEICSKTLAGEKCEVGTVTSSYWEA